MNKPFKEKELCILLSDKVNDREIALVKRKGYYMLFDERDRGSGKCWDLMDEFSKQQEALTAICSEITFDITLLNLNESVVA